MTRHHEDQTPTHRSGRLLAAYLALLTFGVCGLALALTAGDDLEAAPQLEHVSHVEGAAADCLGEILVALQSGQYLDLHHPGHSGVDGPVGALVLRGRIDTDSASVTMDGRCAAGTPSSGERVVADLELDDSGGASGTVSVAGTRSDVKLEPSEAQSSATTEEAPLKGGALAGRMFLAIAVILTTAQLVGLVFSRVRLTRVMGEIVAGIVLGSSLLGAIWPAAGDYLFPAAVTATLAMIGQVGLIFFMFLVGLELNRRLVRGLGHQVVLVSHASIILPFTIGAGLAVALYPRLASGSFTGFALFMGAAMAITAFPVLARILSDTGLNRTPLGGLAITCAAVDDITAWCALAVVIAVVSADGPGGVATTIGWTVVYAATMYFLVKPALRQLALHLNRRGLLGPGTVPGVLVLLLLSAWVTEMIGIHAIFGAFVLGVVMPRPPELRVMLQERMEALTMVFLLPIFFAVVGLSTRVGLLNQPELWFFSVAILVAAIAGKMGGSVFAARMAGHDWRSSGALGLLMNTRGLTEIVILTIGQELGVISPAVFTMMVLMALATTLMATPLLSLFYSRERIEAEAVTKESATPRHQPADLVAP